MLRLYDNFVSGDENSQPYSFTPERHTPIENMHAWVRDDCFVMSSVGNVYVLNTPVFSHGIFTMDFKITYMEEIPPEFTVYFDYDDKRRKGRGIRFSYDLRDKIKISLVDIDISKREIILTTEKKATLSDGVFYTFELNVQNGIVCGNIADVQYSFDVDITGGKIALERENFIGELIIDSVLFETDEEFEIESITDETTAQIPLTNGGDIPYTVSWKIYRIDGESYLTATLDGGTKSRPVNREDRPGQYEVERDTMTNPYIGIVTLDGRRFIFNLAKGDKTFVDPNIYWDCQRRFFGDTVLPITNTYKLPISPDKDIRIIFGYENLICTGYSTQQGGREFGFDLSGRLTYSGDAMDGRDIFELRSNKKHAFTLIPDDCYERDKVIEHINTNHYFETEENIDLDFIMKTGKEAKYFTYNIEILNIYETKTLYKREPKAESKPDEYGYTAVKISAVFPNMDVGIYKARLNIYYGDRFYRNYTKVFEVYNKSTDENPALRSGLPFQFSMPNEQKRLERNAFDLWTPYPSCDYVHYYSCITDTPEEAQKRKVWTLSKSFKRKWFAWIGSRTVNDWNIDKYTDVIENSDYQFVSMDEEVVDLSQSSLFPTRQDHHGYEHFAMRLSQRLGILDDFLSENPDIASRVDYTPGSGKLSFGEYKNLMTICPMEWMEYQNKRGLEILKKNNLEMQRINPSFKRAMYGPIDPYVTPTITYHSLKVYGHSDYRALYEDAFPGFMIFEDYPFACSYHTYRGAFILMTMLLHSPELTVYPEQYSGSTGGCIDGAVKFAHAPMGAYTTKGYENSTHAFEYVFNTAYRLSDGYHYWNTYGFHRSASPIMDAMVRDWHYVIDNKPSKPLKTTAYLAEYSDGEDVFEIYTVNDEKRNCYFMNPSESGHGLVFECTREAGLPNGFAVSYDSILTLSADECDVLVIPSLLEAPDKVKSKIRSLYENGVNLFAVSDVAGLEDIFGVTGDRHTAVINTVCYMGESEYVRENNAVINYRPDGADVLMTSGDGEPLILRTERTCLINTAVTNLGGADSAYMSHAKTIHIVGNLVRKAVSDTISAISSPLAKGDGVGTTLFETIDGRKMLLAIDYTAFDNKAHGVREVSVNINIDGVNDALSDRELFRGRENGSIREIRFDIKPHESVFIELKGGITR